MTDHRSIVFKEVGKHFDGQWVFRNVSLDLPIGTISAIIGESGCGKTTLLQLINGLHEPDEGSVEVLGEPVPKTGLDVFRQRMGYAVQGAGLFPHMTVAENVALPARIKGWSGADIDTRRGELFQFMGLDDGLAVHFPHQLSGGQQHRVGLCRALMLHPELLLLDEPFSAIDPITRHEIYPEFEALRQHENVSVLLVTHDMREAVRLADFLVVMGEGGILRSGPKDEVVADPGDDTVRRLLAI